jgi:hypothetical protein
MIVALQPEQVSIFWDAIKSTFLKTNPCPVGMDEIDYTNKLLEKLLSMEYVAWIVFKYNDKGEKVVHAIGITVIKKDFLTEMQTLHIISLYGFRFLETDLARTSWGEFIKYANNCNCDKIRMESNVKRVFDLAKLVGFVKKSEVWEYTRR